MNGWTCFYCNAFVPDGCMHHCPSSVGSPGSPPSPPPVTKLDPPTLQYLALGERLVSALERLADLLAADLEREANK